MDSLDEKAPYPPKKYIRGAIRIKPNKYKDIIQSQQRLTSGQRRVMRAAARKQAETED